MMNRVLLFNHIHKKDNYSLKWKKPTIHKKTTPINDFVTNSLGDKKAIFENIVKVPNVQIPNWILETPNIISELDNTCTKKENPLYLAMLAKEKIDGQTRGKAQVKQRSGRGQCRNKVNDLRCIII